MTPDDFKSQVLGLFPNARITSLARSPQHNRAVGGVSNSDHLSGNAVDFVVPGMTTAQAAAALRANGVPNRVILDEGNHVHWSGPRAGSAPSGDSNMMPTVEELMRNGAPVGAAPPSGDGGDRLPTPAELARHGAPVGNQGGGPAAPQAPQQRQLNPLEQVHQAAATSAPFKYFAQEVVNPVAGAMQTVRNDVAENRSGKTAPFDPLHGQFGPVGQGLRNAADLAAVPMAAVGGAFHGLVTRPAAAALDAATSGLPMNAAPSLGDVVRGFQHPNSYTPPKPFTPAQRRQAAEGVVNNSMWGIGLPEGRGAALAQSLMAVPRPAALGDAVAVPVARRAAAYVARNATAPDALAMAARESGAPVTTAEMLGRQGQRAAGALARGQGAAGDMMNGVVAGRVAERPVRIQQAFQDVSGIAPADARTTIDNLVKVGRERAAPRYAEAYAHQFPASDKLDALLARPSMKEAVNRAAKIAAEEGRSPTELGFESVGPDGSSIALRTPTMRTLDYVKRGLDDVLNGYRDNVTGKLNLDEHGRAVLSTLKELRTVLTDPAHPATRAYGSALATSGDYLSAEEAFRTGGRQILNSNVPARDFGERFRNLPEANQDAWRAGISDQVFNLYQKGTLKPATLQTPIVRGKLEHVFGKQGAEDLMRSLSSEEAMRAFEMRYAPGAGSVSAEMLAEMKAQNELHPAAQAGLDFAQGALTTKSFSGGVANAIKGAAGKVASEVKTMGMSVPVRNEAQRLLMSQMTPAELQDYIRSINAKKMSAYEVQQMIRRGRSVGPQQPPPVRSLPPRGRR